MRAGSGLLAALLLMGPLLAGCLGGDGPDDPAEPASDGPGFPACEHPWPCADGSEWPAELTSPEGGFDLAETRQLRAPMGDGVELDGAVWLPDVPEGTRVPVVLWVTPYAGQCRAFCDDAPSDSEELAEDFEFLWQHGYAAAAFNLRGTGLSGGCFDYYGQQSQQDMAELVTWLGDRPWSNGRVGMWGVSAMGTTPWMAAIHAPPALKAIAPSGIISDLYLNRFTPQGAPWAESGAFQTRWGTLNSPAPPAGVFTGQVVQDWAEDAPTVVENHPQRLCPEVADWETAGLRSQFTDDRRPAFWQERRFVTSFGNVTAAVLIQQGFRDFGHAYQDDAIWPPLDQAPKRMLLGQWGHELFPDEQLERSPGGNATATVLLGWFDFWLKGVGDPPRVGTVDYQTSDGTWATTTAWPPADHREEVLHLADAQLQPAAGASSSFRAVQSGDPTFTVSTVGCDDWAERQAEAGTALIYTSEPATEPVTIAGNPMAYLGLTSDQPGGIVAADLHVIDETGECERVAGHGAADLRFHQGNAQGQAFPTGETTWVRVDLWSTAVSLTEGERLVAILSGSGYDPRMSQPQYAPELTVAGESHLVLPVVQGSLGGSTPTLDYPPRPFMPEAAS